jgi:hypothetical protein
MINVSIAAVVVSRVKFSINFVAGSTGKNVLFNNHFFSGTHIKSNSTPSINPLPFTFMISGIILASMKYLLLF